MQPWKAIILVGCIIGACQPKDAPRAADPRTVSACMAAEHSHDDYLLVTKCEPLGPTRTFHGTWFVGFEMSVFRMDYSGIPADLGNPFDQYWIVVPTSLDRRVHARDAVGPSAYQVTFQGREALLPKRPGEKLIVADRMLALRAVSMNSKIPSPPG